MLYAVVVRVKYKPTSYLPILTHSTASTTLAIFFLCTQLQNGNVKPAPIWHSVMCNHYTCRGPVLFMLRRLSNIILLVFFVITLFFITDDITEKVKKDIEKEFLNKLHGESILKLSSRQQWVGYTTIQPCLKNPRM